MDDALKSEELPLEPFRCILNHLTGFSRSLARRVTCSGLTGHNRGPTTSSVREKPAFGGSYLHVGCVASLVQCYGIALRARACPSEQI